MTMDDVSAAPEWQLSPAVRGRWGLDLLSKTLAGADFTFTLVSVPQVLAGLENKKFLLF